jgi:Raf kinase inhibitor-like YbhB/YbcL family protein
VARRRGILVALLCSLSVAGCGDAPAELDVDTAATLEVTSEAFSDGGTIPVQFTCDGEETSPPLTWAGPPGDARAWALVVDDPDAPGGTFVHWVVLDVPLATRSLAAGSVPPGTAQAVNSAGQASYAGPCPPSGTHHYRFTVYGLSEPTGLSDGAALDDALQMIRSAASAHGSLVGVYQHRSP